MAERLYFIASLKHTSREHEHIAFWGRNHCGYTTVVGDYIGEYDEREAAKLNDGCSTLAVPVDVVRGLVSEEPYYVIGNGPTVARFYDQRGPVVDNTLANWRALVAAAMRGFVLDTRPQHFTRKRRSFAISALKSSIDAAHAAGDHHDQDH